jgi:hypothetical protein
MSNILIMSNKIIELIQIICDKIIDYNDSNQNKKLIYWFSIHTY